MATGFSFGRGDNYTGMLTRSIVFSGALIVFLASTSTYFYGAKD